MFKRFIFWLVRRFCTIHDISDYIVEHAFLKNPAWVIQEMVYRGNQRNTSPKGFPHSTTVLGADILLKRPGYTAALYLLTLMKIKESKIYGSPDYKDEAFKWFLEGVQAIKEENANPLKLRKELTEYVKNNLALVDDLEIIDIVHVLTHRNIHTEAACDYVATGV